MKEDMRRIRHLIAEKLRESEYSEKNLIEEIDRVLTEWGRGRRLSLKEKEEYRKGLLDSFRGMDILQPLLEDEGVTEIMVNGPFTVFVERGSEMSLWDKGFSSRDALDDVIQGMAASVNRLVNTSSPIADLRLADGSRVNIVLPPAAPDGPAVTIRKFSKDPLTMEKLLMKGTLTPAAAEFLKSAVICGCNIFISGGTGSGKTTFLNALSAFIPPEERIITIEDSLELQLQGLPNLVRLETRDPNLEGSGRISIRDLIRTALRMRPNRIVVGEVRGEEALDMLQAMNTGHRGSLSTGHANSARHMLSRLETMVLMGGELPLGAIRSQIASALEILVHLGRGRDRKRRVLSVSEILGMEGGESRVETIRQYDPEQGLVFTGHQPVHTEKWREVFGKKPAFTQEGDYLLRDEAEPLSLDGLPGLSKQTP
ncbi:MAG: CpaF family protein [Lachnospiraceae bacterium]|nr:CpaF family protein [Lachnospiraceae bacterium]